MEGLTVLRLIYWIMAGGGTLLVAILLFLGTEHDLVHSLGHDFGHDGGVDHGQGEGPAPISLRTLLAFIGGWGWGGLIGLDGLHWGLLSIPFGSGIGFVLAFAVFQFMCLLHAQEVTSTVGASQLVGQDGIVLTAIPAGGTGEVRVNAHGTVIKCLARAEDEGAVAVGTAIEVVEEVGGTLLVRRA